MTTAIESMNGIATRDVRSKFADWTETDLLNARDEMDVELARRRDADQGYNEVEELNGLEKWLVTGHFKAYDMSVTDCLMLTGQIIFLLRKEHGDPGYSSMAINLLHLLRHGTVTVREMRGKMRDILDLLSTGERIDMKMGDGTERVLLGRCS